MGRHTKRQLPPSSSDRPLLHEFHDYRDWILATVKFEKSRSTGITLTHLAKKAKISQTLLSLVIKRKRNLPAPALQLIGQYLQLNKAELRYLENLRVLSDSNEIEAKRLALEHLQASSLYQAHHPRELQAYQYLSRWYFVAIRELAHSQQFQEDPNWIQGQLRFRVSVPEIREALSFLIKQGLLRRDATGRLTPAHQRIECMDGIYGLALGSFHQEILELSQSSIKEIPPSERHLLGNTLLVPTEKWPMIQTILSEAHRKISELEVTASPESQQLLHIELVAIPLSHPLTQESKS